MLFKNFELYNVAELVPHEDGIGWRMSRGKHSIMYIRATADSAILLAF